MEKISPASETWKWMWPGSTGAMPWKRPHGQGALGGRVRRALRIAREQTGGGGPSGGDHDQVVVAGDPVDLGRVRPEDDHAAAALQVVGGERGQVEAEVDAARGGVEAAEELDPRLPAGHETDAEGVVVPSLPVRDAQLALPVPGLPEPDGEAQRAPRRELLGAALGVDRRGHPGLLEPQGEVQARDACADDGDV